MAYHQHTWNHYSNHLFCSIICLCSEANIDACNRGVTCWFSRCNITFHWNQYSCAACWRSYLQNAEPACSQHKTESICLIIIIIIQTSSISIIIAHSVTVSFASNILWVLSHSLQSSWHLHIRSVTATNAIKVFDLWFKAFSMQVKGCWVHQAKHHPVKLYLDKIQLKISRLLALRVWN